MHDFLLFPNPSADGLFHIQSESIDEIKIFQSNGKMIKEMSGTELNSIDLSNFGKGVFHFRIRMNDGRYQSGTLMYH